MKQFWKRTSRAKLLPALALLFSICISACSKKHQPQRETPIENEKPPEVKAKLPRVITVNDKVAKKSVDGRLYYDVDGRRYWKNYNDGKYYLFNKTMYNDPAFKPH